jgi:protein-disulfide isomerase
MNEPQNENRQILNIPTAIIIAGAIIAGAVIYTMKPTVSSNPNSVTKQQAQIKPVTNSDHILGNPNAPIKIVEYSDTECPFCKRFHDTLHKIMTDYGKSGKVAWVYRQFPIVGLHPKAPKESEATECVAELGGNDKFWQYLDKIYETMPASGGLDPAQLPILASEVGVDITAFNTCLNSGKMKARVDASIKEGQTAGARGTPYSVIITKDEKIPITQGALPYEEMKRIIDLTIKSL